MNVLIKRCVAGARLHTPPGGRARRQVGRQMGQALVEGLVVLIVLLSFWIGIAWLGRLQDTALQAQHASRYAAFALTRDPGAYPLQDIRDHYFSGPAHRWSDRSGRAVLAPGLPEVMLEIDRAAALDAASQPGGDGMNATRLRTEWHIKDAGVVRSLVRVAPQSQSARYESTPKTGSAGLAYFDSAYPVLRRHTAILTDAGHAANDAAAQQRVSDSNTAWEDSANRTRALGKRIDSAMQAVDAGWNRTGPVLDWLNPWAGHVPGRHIVSSEGAPHAR